MRESVEIFSLNRDRARWTDELNRLRYLKQESCPYRGLFLDELLKYLVHRRHIQRLLPEDRHWDVVRSVSRVGLLDRP